MRTIQEILAEIEASRAAKSEEAEETRTELAAAMQAAGVANVLISFSGAGDSGCIDDIEITMAPGHEEPVDLREKLNDFADTYLAGTGVDWYNNDGGQGEIEFDLTTTPALFKAYVDQNVTTSETVWTEEDGA